MAATWWRWNPTTHIFEISTNEGATFAPPTLNASVINEGSFGIAQGGTGATSFTSGRVVFYNGSILTGDADLTFSGDTLTVTKLSTPTIITASGALGITPASGSNLNITLGTTGDLVVNTTQLYVDTSTGFVGVGTSAPVVKLHVVGTGAAWGNNAGIFDIRVGTGGNDARVSFGYSPTGNYGWIRSVRPGVANDYLVLNPDGGNIGINVTAPSAVLHTIGTVRFANFGAGTATFDASGNISSVSDSRLKTDILPLSRGLKEILSIQGVTFHYSKKSGLDITNIYSGFIAQDIMKFIPEAVGKGSDGYYTLNERTIVATLVNAIKELQEEIDELRVVNSLPAYDKNITPIIGDDGVIKTPE